MAENLHKDLRYSPEFRRGYAYAKQEYESDLAAKQVELLRDIEDEVLRAFQGETPLVTILNSINDKINKLEDK